MNPYLQAVTALNNSGSPYCVVGGFSVVLHGVNRFTPDLNVVVDFQPESVQKLIAALKDSQLESSQDVDPAILSNEKSREEFFQDGSRRFIGFYDLRTPTFSVDIFVKHPLDFEQLHKDSVLSSIDNDHSVRICSLEHLIEMKSETGRGQDKIDVENLQIIKQIRDGFASGRSLEESLKQLDEDIPHDRAQNLANFFTLESQEKMNWLLEMFNNLGQFCIS